MIYCPIQSEVVEQQETCVLSGEASNGSIGSQITSQIVVRHSYSITPTFHYSNIPRFKSLAGNGRAGGLPLMQSLRNGRWSR